MHPDEKLKILIQEIRDQELEIRQQLRTSNQNASLSIVIIALAGTFFATQVNILAFCFLPVFLNIAALSHLNSAIDIAHQAILRDWLQKWANIQLAAPVFMIGELTNYRRLSASGIAVNAMAGTVLVASWTLGVIVAIPQPWLWAQILGTAVLVSLSGWAFYDYATIRRRTADGLTNFTPSF